MRVAKFFVATSLPASPLSGGGGWPVGSESTLVEGRLTAPKAFARPPWLQITRLPTCAASNKQSGGITGKIRSTRLDGISDITIKPPRPQQISQKVSGDISRN